MKTSPGNNQVWSIQILVAALALSAGFPRAVCAEDYLGASNVLARVEASKAKPTVAAKPDEAAQLRDALKAFRLSQTNLAPTEAAQQWLAFVDRAVKVKKQSARNYDGNSPQLRPDDLLAALPPPSAWSALAKAVAARPAVKGNEELREAGLRLLTATLTGDVAARNAEFTLLQNKAKSAEREESYFYNNALQQLGQATLATSDDPDAIIKSLGYQLAQGDGRSVQSLQVPNLISLIGTEKTEAFLRKALVAPNVVLQFRSPNETSRLAQKLALELMGQLKTAQWGLVNSLDAVELYEALNRQFPPATNNLAALTGLTNEVAELPAINDSGDNPKVVAQVYYVLGLISKDRTAEAVVEAKKLRQQYSDYLFEEAFKSMQNAGYMDALDNFFYELMTQDPTLPFWDKYVEVAVNAGQTKRMLALVRTAAGREDLSETRKSALRQILFKALLAADEVDGAVEEARRLITLDTATPMNGGYNAGQLGMMLARIGILLPKPELIEEGIATTKKWISTANEQSVSRAESASVVGSLAEILVEIKRGPEAESILADALVEATATRNSSETYGWNRGNAARPLLTKLLTIYYEAGRYADVLTLLQASPNWGAKDVSELFQMGYFNDEVVIRGLHTGSSTKPIPFMAASALAATGQKEVAEKINNALLDENPGLDRGYELLLSLKGTNALPKLDELFARDLFEERPLIWKAHLLRQQNQLDEAEQVIRQAISIDPSDGEEGRDDRMRAYAELAAILDARGNKKDANTYREVIKAIRLSEQADQYFQAGLLKRAVAMYEDALTHFSDAYCIQSRLAIQLAALGDTAGAEEHYRRAFELMPDSFGRVESHCFGCERAFDGERAQSIAEKVFSQVAAQNPKKPQVHYLLGYLREEQERYNEALTNYLTAVRLDPDYLNAWAKVQSVSEQALLSPKMRDEVVFNMLRLDPLHRHVHPSVDRVSDLARLWSALANAAAQRPAPVSDLWPLTASKTALDKKAANSVPERRMWEISVYEQLRKERDNPPPALEIAENPFIRVARSMIFSNADSYEY